MGQKKENEPQRKYQESVLVQNATAILFLQIISKCVINDFCHTSWMAKLLNLG